MRCTKDVRGYKFSLPACNDFTDAERDCIWNTRFVRTSRDSRGWLQPASFLEREHATRAPAQDPRFLCPPPEGAVSDVGIIPHPPDVSGATDFVGATYDRPSRRWLPVRPEAVSPGGARYAYVSGGVHVVDVASGADRIAYSGPTNFIVIAFASDAVYLAQATNPRQGISEKLFRLDLVGGSPQLVLGSDRQMYQSGWVLISGGAAWGVDYRVQGSTYTYLVLRLDLTTATVTEWLESPPDRQFAPLGTDERNRLYVSDGYEVWRLEQPRRVQRLLNPPPEPGALTFGTFSYDSQGAWFAGRGRIWLYADGGGTRQFKVGPANEMVFPAGTCSRTSD